jgi:hypothetical protein
VVELIESRMSELRALCERYQVERLALFGSALREDFDSGDSDTKRSLRRRRAPAPDATQTFGRGRTALLPERGSRGGLSSRLPAHSA